MRLGKADVKLDVVQLCETQNGEVEWVLGGSDG